MSEKEEIYDKYLRVAGIVLRTTATLLAIIFAYTLSAERLHYGLQVYITILVILLTIVSLISGLAILLGRKEEPETFKWFVIASFLMMIILIVLMLILLLVTVYGPSE